MEAWNFYSSKYQKENMISGLEDIEDMVTSIKGSLALGSHLFWVP